jgi:hypothetical protein
MLDEGRYDQWMGDRPREIYATDKSYLTVHYPLLACDHCPAKFFKRDSLTAHRVTIHADKEAS